MNELSISRLRQMSKEELFEQVFSLSLENKTLANRLVLRPDKKGVDSGVTQSLSGYDEEHKRLLDKLSSLVFTCNAKGEISYVNQACLDFIGYSKSELLGENILKVVHEESRELAMSRIMARFQYSPTEINEYKVMKKDGSTIWVEIFGVTVEGASEVEESFLLVNAIDVSKRVAADQALRKSESLFRGFADNLQAAIYMLNEKGEIIYANPFASEISGYSNKELLGLPGYATINPDDREKAMVINKARLGGKDVPSKYDLRLLVKGDEVKWVELHLERFELDGRVVALGTAIDITDRIESEAALKESEAKFRNLFERSTDPMLLLDESGFFDCNLAAVKAMKANCKADVMVHPGLISPELQPDGSRSKLKAELGMKEAYAKGTNRFEWLHRDFSGELFWADVSLTVIPFKNRKILFTVWRNISDIKKLEQLLRDEREQLLVTLRSIGDAVITTDIEGRVVLINRVAENLTGWSQKEALGRMIDEILTLVSGKTGAPVVNPLARAVSGAIVLDQPDATILLSRNGQRFKIADSASPIRDEKSRIIGGVMVFRDISDSERLQEEILKFKKLESVGRLAGGIAHDFNNLLTGIMGNLEVAGLRLTKDPERARVNIEKSLKASRRAADLTQKLLTFAKGGEPIKKTEDLGEIIRDSAEFVMSGSNVALELEVSEELWAAEVDTGQISQVIQNLVINAVQAMPDGGTILIRSENFHLESSETPAVPLPPGAYVRISVKDQGHGIASELRQKIFDPFFTTRPEGSGLGLSVIHSIIRKHGGHVTVSSESGKYTDFTLFLPALGDRFQEPGSVAGMRLQPPRRSGRILVMDDEELICEILTGFLNGQGYEVVAVSDGREALKEYRQQKFSLVILDLTIPGGLGGRETIKLLKEYDPDVKAVVSSGYANDPLMAAYEKFGFCGCLNKPYILEDLLQLVDRIEAG